MHDSPTQALFELSTSRSASAVERDVRSGCTITLQDQVMACSLSMSMVRLNDLQPSAAACLAECTRSQAATDGATACAEYALFAIDLCSRLRSCSMFGNMFDDGLVLRKPNLLTVCVDPQMQ